VTTPVVEVIEGIDLDHTPPCEAQVNGLRCRAESEYRITFFCCGSRVVFLCQTCFTILQLTPLVGCLYCDQPIGEWRLA
jgi:hypothetical protein